MTMQDVGILLAGLLWPVIYQFIRRSIAPDLQGQVAHAAAVIVCFVIAAALDAMTTGTVTPAGLLAHGAEIATLAWIVYRQAVKPVESQSAPSGGTAP